MLILKIVMRGFSGCLHLMASVDPEANHLQFGGRISLIRVPVDMRDLIHEDTGWLTKFCHIFFVVCFDMFSWWCLWWVGDLLATTASHPVRLRLDAEGLKILSYLFLLCRGALRSRNLWQFTDLYEILMYRFAQHAFCFARSPNVSHLRCSTCFFA